MIREIAVDFAEEFLHRAAESAIEIGRGSAGDAVAAVDGDFHRSCELDAADDVFEIFGGDVFFAIAAGAAGKFAGLGACAQRRDGVTGKRFAGQHDLDAVVLRRVVRTGEHGARHGVEVVGGEVEHRRADAADVDDLRDFLAALPLDVAQATVQRLTDRLIFTCSATEFYMAPAFAWFRGPDDLNWLRPEEGRVIQVVDEHGRECPPGVQGLVRIRLREFDVQSYFEDEQATARAFRDGFCYPGDLGVMHADGRVRLLGRDGDVINIAGQKIPAALIEEGLQMTREMYLSIVLDRAAGKPVMMASADGGMDIEEVAAKTPERIAKVYIEPGVGIVPFEARHWGRKGFEASFMRALNMRQA